MHLQQKQIKERLTFFIFVILRAEITDTHVYFSKASTGEWNSLHFKTDRLIESFCFGEYDIPMFTR